MGKLSRIILTDAPNPADPTGGSPIGNATFQELQNAIEDDIMSANYPLITGRSIIDNAIAGLPRYMGGNANIGFSNNVYPAGATAYVAGEWQLIPNGGIWTVDSILLQEGTYVFEVIAWIDNPISTVTIGFFNLTDAPTVPIVEVFTSAQTGLRKVSTPIVFAQPGVAKDYALKGKVSSTTPIGKGWDAWVRRAS